MKSSVRILALMLVLGMVGSACQKDREVLVVTSFGGAWQSAQSKAMFEPFSQAHDVEVMEREYEGQYALIEEKGAAGEWDVIDVEAAELLRGASEGLYEEIDYSLIDETVLLDSAVHPYGVGLMTYSIVFGYDPAHRSEDGEAPRTWADFWDLERFPGKRALPTNPQWVFEIALLADGVAPEELYPIDVERALSLLDRIREAVVTFEDLSQPAEMIANGEAALAVGTNGRLLAARDEGKPIAISWASPIVSLDYFVIPRGSKNKDLAQQLVAYAVGEEAQAAFPQYIDYGPVNELAMKHLSPEKLHRLPTDPLHLESSVFFDAAWWEENKEEASRRYEDWLQSAGASANP